MADDVITELLERCRADHRAWINGDASGYGLPVDGTIMGAVGGHATGGAGTAAVQARVAAAWASGTGSVELVNSGLAGDLAWLAMIERAVVRFADEDHDRRWDLRVTEVFRRVDGDWQRVHRHADPLVDRRSVQDVRDLLT